MKKIIMIAIILVLSIVMFFKVMDNEVEVEDRKIENYLKGLKIEFSGIVNSNKYLGHGVSKIYIDISNSNIEDYNPKDSLQYYLCIIKKNKAELIVTNEKDFMKGDSVVVSSIKDSCFIYNQSKIIKSKWKLYVVNYHANNEY